MVNWLYRLSDFAVFSILILPFVVIVVAAALLGRRLRARRAADTSSFEIMDAFIAVASAAAVVLAFSLVQVDTSLRSIDDNITKEANAINALDRVMLRFGDREILALRAPLSEYAKAIVRDEWPQLAEGERSDKVDDIQRLISNGLRGIEPVTPRQVALFGEALRTIDVMTDMRESRLNAASTGLSNLFWKSILAIFASLVVIAFHTDPTRKRIWSMAAIAATLGVLLSLVVILDAPFAGETTVQPEAIERVIGVIAARK